MNVVPHLFSTLPVVVALLLLRVANVPKPRRHQQYALPAIAVIYAIAALIVLYRFNGWFDALLDWLFGLLPFLAGLYQTQWLYLIENTLIVTAFLSVKYLYRLWAGRMFSGERFVGSELVEHFYEYDTASGRWFVRARFSQVRFFYRVLFWASIAITVLLIFAMRQFPDWAGFTAISFPAIAVLVLGEVWYALDGVTKAEANDVLTGEQDSAHRIVNYAALRKVFRQVFGERVLDEGVDITGPSASQSYETLSHLAQSEENIDQLFAEYFARAKRMGLDVDDNLVHASLGVLHGNSTLINSPFYTDLTHYLALPSYVRLLRGGKCLVVVGRDSIAAEVTAWFNEGLAQITGIPDLWDVRVLTESAADGLDVGVLRAADLHNLELLSAHDDFLHEVEVVVLVEPSRVLATGQLGLGVTVSRVNRGVPPVYIGIDRNHDGLVDALSHLLKVNLTDVVATSQPLGASSEMVWNAEGQNLASQLLPGVARYLGVGTEVAALAMKYHVSQIDWIGGDRFPVVDMSWIAGQYFGKINSFAEMELSQRALSSALRPRANPLGVEQTERQFLVVEDEISNVYESLRLYGSRFTESGFVNLISENYLMRDYMIDNRDLFSVDPKAIPAIVPDYARTRRNTVMRLLMLLAVFEVAEAALLRELELVGCRPTPQHEPQDDFSDAPVIVLLRGLIEQYLGISEVQFETLTSVKRNEDGDEIVRSFRLERGDTSEQVMRNLGSAYFLIEDETEARDYIGACLRGHVAQTVLPGQFLTVGGKYYEVLSVGEQGRLEEVVLRRAAEHINGRPHYRQLRSFSIADCRAQLGSLPKVERDHLTVELLTATVTATTHGYLESQGRADLNDTRRVVIEGLPERRYLEKSVLRIEVPGASASVRGTIALLLNELFVTLFPNGHQFLVALTRDAEHGFGPLLPEIEVDDDAIYLVEDSFVDMGLLIAAHRHWKRLFETVTDYLKWLETPREEATAEPMGSVTFAGETAEEIAERERRIAEAEERGSYLAPKRPSAWKRFVAWCKKRFARKPKPVDDETEAGDAADTGEAEEPGGVAAAEAPAAAETATGVEADVANGAVSEPEFEMLFEPEDRSETGPEPDLVAAPEDEPAPEITAAEQEPKDEK